MRGMDGVLPRPTALADESYLDFVEAFRKFTLRQVGPAMQQAGTRVLNERVGEAAAIDADLDTVKDAFNATSIARSWQRMMRTHQEMMWRRVRESFVRDAESEVASMDRAAEARQGSLEIDPDFQVPDTARHEIHLQPGGYTDDPIGGVVYHYGTKVFYEGMNDQDELHHELAAKLTLPADGRLAKILDIGCSIGQGTIALKQRYPDADVIGLDVGAPMVRYANKMAVERDCDVRFVQRLAEDTGFEDDSFDTVMSYILFHEVPVNSFGEIAQEMFRILRPGGTFCIFEFPNHGAAKVAPAWRFIIDYDSRNNCEPFSPGFVYSDFQQIIRDAGFQLEPGPLTSNGFLQSLVATKPA